MRVVIADDSVLLREGLSRLLGEAGITTCAMVGDAESLIEAVALHEPELALVDIRMPPTFTHEGASAALRLRTQWPSLGILLLSQSLETRFAAALIQAHPQRFGYLLKDHVLEVSTLVDAVHRIAAGGTVLDPDVIRHLLGRKSVKDRISTLTEREREVLALMAQGRSNGAICLSLKLTDKTVESHIAHIFTKLDLHLEPADHRRVLAVLAWLQPNVAQP
jgi:DNA-binding NarL/FixJ family response regulator